MFARSVLIVDDHLAFAEAVGLAVDLEPDLTYAGTAVTAAEALRAVGAARPDALIIDVGLFRSDGIDLVPEIHRLSPDSRILLIAEIEEPDLLTRANAAGVDAVVRKNDALPSIINAIRHTAEGPTPSDALIRLTDRERQVLDLLAQGQTVVVIARQLGITVNTCRSYVRTILEKLDAHSQLAAVARAQRLGILTTPPIHPPRSAPAAPRSE